MSARETAATRARTGAVVTATDLYRHLDAVVGGVAERRKPKLVRRDRTFVAVIRVIGEDDAVESMKRVGARELAHSGGALVDELVKTQASFIVTFNDQPQVILEPLQTEAFEKFLVEHAPSFVNGILEADESLRRGEGVSTEEIARKLDVPLEKLGLQEAEGD